MLKLFNLDQSNLIRKLKEEEEEMIMWECKQAAEGGTTTIKGKGVFMVLMK